MLEVPSWQIVRNNTAKVWPLFGLYLGRLTEVPVVTSVSRIVIPEVDVSLSDTFYKCGGARERTVGVGIQSCTQLNVVAQGGKSDGLVAKPFALPLDFLRSGPVLIEDDLDTSNSTIYQFRVWPNEKDHDRRNIRVQRGPVPLRQRFDSYNQSVSTSLEWQETVSINEGDQPVLLRFNWISGNPDQIASLGRLFVQLDSNLVFEQWEAPTDGEELCFDLAPLCANNFLLATQDRPDGQVICSLEVDINTCPGIEPFEPSLNATDLCLTNSGGLLEGSRLWMFDMISPCVQGLSGSEILSCFILNIREVHEIGPELIEIAAPESTTESTAESTVESTAVSGVGMPGISTTSGSSTQNHANRLNAGQWPAVLAAGALMAVLRKSRY
jgi:hypothetical protein